jgi:hypothetical protein
MRGFLPSHKLRVCYNAACLTEDLIPLIPGTEPRSKQPDTRETGLFLIVRVKEASLCGDPYTEQEIQSSI